MNDRIRNLFFESMDKEYPNLDFSNCQFTITFRLNYSAMSLGYYVINVFLNDLSLEKTQDIGPTFVMQFNCAYSKDGIDFYFVESSDTHSIFLSKLLCLDCVTTLELMENWFLTKNIKYILEKLNREVENLIKIQDSCNLMPRIYSRRFNFA
jgi:hypothetical protein